MSLQYVTSLRNSRQALTTAAVDAGAGAGFLRGYDGVQPATGGAVTTLLFECTFSDPSFAAPVAGVLTANAITDDASANASGTATWFRCTDSDGNAVMDAPIADLSLNTNIITAGINVAINGYVVTDGNP